MKGCKICKKQQSWRGKNEKCRVIKIFFEIKAISNLKYKPHGNYKPGDYDRLRHKAGKDAQTARETVLKP